MSTFDEAEVSQVIGCDICQGQEPIGDDVGAFLHPCPHLLESRFRATASFLRLLIRGARGARHWEKLMSSLNNDVPSTGWEGAITAASSVSKFLIRVCGMFRLD